MVQSINAKALITLASVIRRPYLACPHVSVSTISEINYPLLKSECGIRAIVFDKDNTLTSPYKNEIHPLASQGLLNALETFGYDRVAILSNSAGTADDTNYKDALNIERELGISVIKHDEKKPGGLQELMNHFQGMNGNNNNKCEGEGGGGGGLLQAVAVDESSQICIIGDRLLTDIVFGNLYGMLTIHCLPLCSGKENNADNAMARILRKLENTALYSDWFGSRMVRNRRLKHAIWQGESICPLTLQQPEPSSTSTISPNES